MVRKDTVRKKIDTNYKSGNYLGANYTKDKTRFLIWSPTAEMIKVALYGKNGENYKNSPERIINMEKEDGETWILDVNEDLKGEYYNFLVTSNGIEQEATDPYARAVGVNGKRGMIIDLSETNPKGWEKDKRPILDEAIDSILYEMHIRDFSIDENSGVDEDKKGKFIGACQENTVIPNTKVKTCIDHLKELGINTIHLMPVCDYYTVDESKLDIPQYNWGYDPQNYNVPEGSFSTNPFKAEIRIKEYKEMIMNFHKAGIRVVMDMVYNHTYQSYDSNLNKAAPDCYYRKWADGSFSNGSGCGNEISSERPMVRKFIVESVLYWVNEYHIDGFRFDLASILSRDQNGAPMSNPPLLEVLAHDAILSKCKLIAEAWDAGGLYQVGNFPSWGRWAEWNGKFRDTMRKFVKGEGYEASNVMKRIEGSEDLYHNRTSNASINFITCHDGFTLYDLVSYNEKHNFENGEENRDGCNDNYSWNCGYEGECTDIAVNALRRKQIKNMITLLLISRGIPMILSGDEFCNTQFGNNNAYCQDNEISWLDWNRLKKNEDIFKYFKKMIGFRKSHPVLRNCTFDKGYNKTGYPELSWHGEEPWNLKNSDNTLWFAIMLAEEKEKYNVECDSYIYIAINMHWESHGFTLPDIPKDKKWYMFSNTNFDEKINNFEQKEDILLENQKNILVSERSIIILVGR